MEYAAWCNDFDQDFACLSVKLRDIEVLEDITGHIRFGRSVKDLFPKNEVILKLEGDSGIPLPDYLPNFRGWLVVSERLKDLLLQTEEHFEVYPLSIQNQKGHLLQESYFLAHLIGALECLDKDLSDYDLSAVGSGQVSCFRRLVLDEAKIPAEKQIFRLGEKEDLIIVNERLGRKIYDLNMTGMYFPPMEDFGEEYR